MNHSTKEFLPKSEILKILSSEKLISITKILEPYKNNNLFESADKEEENFKSLLKETKKFLQRQPDYKFEVVGIYQNQNQIRIMDYSNMLSVVYLINYI